MAAAGATVCVGDQEWQQMLFAIFIWHYRGSISLMLMGRYFHHIADKSGPIACSF